MPETSTIHTIRIPGQTDIKWDTADPGSVAKAEVAFNKAKSQGMLAYAPAESGGASGGTVITEFDPMVDIRMQTQHQGG